MGLVSRLRSGDWAEAIRGKGKEAFPTSRNVMSSSSQSNGRAMGTKRSGREAFELVIDNGETTNEGEGVVVVNE